ncbi:MAG: UDP-N-acetylmuramoyl-tripeptide--D-alanyl-D-alanine ligase [Gemmatimonadetes bacterium]|nr:UDP-N-acetylmuramoyl-tripeptide--D-alanyl-D-alanine ligase [Gemmatimonadota bacterium]
MTLGEVAHVARAVWKGAPAYDRPFAGVATDTRGLSPGSVFVAIEGENFDGHRFVTDAFHGGAVAALVQHDRVDDLSNATADAAPPLLAVDDPLRALGRIARHYRRGFTGPVVGVTGSAGKTTAKEMIAAVLGCRFQVHKTPANENNELGVPRSVLGLTATHNAAVFELAARHVGDIAYLADVVRPTIGVLLNIGTAHLEVFKSVERVAKAKGELLDSIRDESCVAFVNVDDCVIARGAKRTKGRLLGFGLKREGHFSGEGLVLDQEGCGHFSLQHTSFPRTRFQLAIPGRHNVYNALAAIAVGVECGIPPAASAEVLANFPPVGMRSQFLRNRGIRVINDCYNANPESLRAAIDLLVDIEVEGRRVAIVGDMLELGAKTEELHQEAGRYMADRLDVLLTTGSASQALGEAARAQGMAKADALHFTSQDDLLDHARHLLTQGDTVLVKASRGVGLEYVAEGLLSDPN